jgi:hypothetical protein
MDGNDDVYIDGVNDMAADMERSADMTNDVALTWPMTWR